jgi:hypothetical protein
MKNLVSSQERLLNLSNIDKFKDLFISHGLAIDRRVSREFSEIEIMEVIPLVFGLMPKNALYREKKDQRIKPLVRDHLCSIGFKSIDEELVAVIKEVSDQYYYTAGKRPLRTKLSISDIRMGYRRDYIKLRESQNNRCKICGINLSDSEEHLDHKIPFRLIGDIPGGINWQLLCNKCNTGKSSYLSALQPLVSQNWIYGTINEEVSNPDDLSDTQWGYTVRYSILAQKKKCEFEDCSCNTNNSKLSLRIKNPSGLPIIDNLIVLCENHF